MKQLIIILSIGLIMLTGFTQETKTDALKDQKKRLEEKQKNLIEKKINTEKLEYIKKYSKVNELITRYNNILNCKTNLAFYFYSGTEPTLYRYRYINKTCELFGLINSIDEEYSNIYDFKEYYNNKKTYSFNTIIFMSIFNTVIKSGKVISITPTGVLLKNTDKNEIFHVLNCTQQQTAVDGDIIKSIMCYKDSRYQYSAADGSLSTVTQYKELSSYKGDLQNKKYIDVDDWIGIALKDVKSIEIIKQ